MKLGLSLHERVLKLEPSATLGMVTRANELKRQGVSVITLSAGEPDFATPAPILEAAKRALYESDISHYTSVRGTDELVGAIKEKFKRSHGLEFQDSEVLSTVGGKAAISLAIDSLVGPGDEVIIFAPYWVSFPELVKLAGASPVFVECKATDGYLPKLEAFKKAINHKTKAVIINTPNNPTGAVYPEKLLRELMNCLVDTPVWVLSDEIYEHLVFDGVKHVSVATLSDDARLRTLIISGVAKAYAMTGWRVGFVGGPRELVGAMLKLQSQRYTCVTAVAQAAAAFALRESSEVTAAMAKMQQAFEQRRDKTVELIKKLPGVKSARPQGAFFAMLDVSEHIGRSIKGSVVKDDLMLATRLLEEAHVATVPGSSFGAPNSIRISTASSLSDIEEGLTRIGQFLAL